MSLVLVKSICRLLSGVILLCAAGVGYWAVQQPDTAAELSEAVPAPIKAVDPPDIPSFDALEPLVAQRLRAPLYDPPPSPPPTEPPPAPVRVDWKLVGTVLEPGRNKAILTSPEGKTYFREVGDLIAEQPAEMYLESVSERDAVLRITKPRVTEVTLSMETARAN